MPRNASGNYSLPGGTTATPSTTIASAPYNAFLADITTEITDSLDRSGKGGLLADLDANSHKVKNLATPTANADAATKSYVDSGAANLGRAGQLFGLTLSNDSGGTTAIAVAAGSARDSTDVDTMVLSSALTGKVLANAWTVGNAGGFLDTGAVANTTYHVYLIKRPDTGVVDAIASTSASAPTLPTNYTLYRRIGSILREGGAIVLFKQDGDYFRRAVGLRDISVTNPGSAAVTRTLSVPVGIPIWADVVAWLYGGGSVNIAGLLTALDETDTTPSTGGLFNFYVGATAGVQGSGTAMFVKTNTSAQIRSRINPSAAGDQLVINTFGWRDTRGRIA